MGNPIWSVGAGFTSKCNMCCDFCYSKKVRKYNDDLSLEVWQRFIKENGSMIRCINYGTGENTLVKEWFELTEFVRDSFPRINQALTTNGFLATATKNQVNLDAFVRTIDEVDISLDFADSNKHNKIRGVDYAYNMALETAKLCQESKKITTFVMLGVEETLNTKNLEAIFNIAKRFGAFVRINLYRPTYKDINKAPKFESIIKALDWIIENHHVISFSDPLISSLYSRNKKSDPSGKKSLRILPHGGITPSTYLVTPEWVAGNIMEANILEKLPERKPFKVLRRTIIPKDCTQCQFLESCGGGTYDRRILFYGSLEERDPYCPFRHNSKYNVSYKDFDSDNNAIPQIHADYLPTMIFSPR